MSVTAVASTNTGTPEQETPLIGPKELGRDEFLKLLVAQLANQDPLEPLQGSEFVAQLAQFSSVEQLLQVNNRLDMLGVGQAAISNAQTASLIGREVTATSEEITIAEGGAPPLAFELEDKATDVKITISDSSGTIVRTIDLGPRTGGPNEVPWDGKNMSGATLPPGVYKVSVSATDVDGQPIPATSRVQGVITGVTFENGFPEIMIGEVRVRLGDIISIETPKTKEGTP